jgi:hypothetical protein
LSLRNVRLDQLIIRLREKFLLRGPLSSTQMASLDDAPKLCKGSFAVLLSDVSDLINGLGSSVSAMFNGLAKEERDGLCSAFGTLLVDLADCVCNISPERNGDKSSSSNLLSPDLTKRVRIHDAVKLRSSCHTFPLPR